MGTRCELCNPMKHHLLTCRSWVLNILMLIEMVELVGSTVNSVKARKFSRNLWCGSRRLIHCLTRSQSFNDADAQHKENRWLSCGVWNLFSSDHAFLQLVHQITLDSSKAQHETKVIGAYLIDPDSMENDVKAFFVFRKTEINEIASRNLRVCSKFPRISVSESRQLHHDR